MLSTSLTQAATSEHRGIVHTVTLIAGDGIGPEIAEAVKRVFAVAARGQTCWSSLGGKQLQVFFAQQWRMS